MADELHDIVQRMIDGGESEENIAAVIKEYKPVAPPTALTKEQTEESVPAAMYRGFREGVMGGLKGTAKAALPAIGQGLMAPAMPFYGAYKAMTQPVDKTIQDVKDIGSGMAGQARTALEATDVLAHPLRTLTDPMSAMRYSSPVIHKAGSDPQAAGAEIGGGAIALGTSAALPLVPKPIARVGGRGLAEAGKLAKWPVMMAGAHRMVMGDVPTGAAMMMAPKLAIKAGTALENWATPEGVLAAKTAGAVKAPKTGDLSTFQDNVERGINTKLKQPIANSSKGVESLDQAIAAREAEAAQIRRRASSESNTATKAEQKADADWYRQQQASDTTAAAPSADIQDAILRKELKRFSPDMNDAAIDAALKGRRVSTPVSSVDKLAPKLEPVEPIASKPLPSPKSTITPEAAGRPQPPPQVLANLEPTTRKISVKNLQTKSKDVSTGTLELSNSDVQWLKDTAGLSASSIINLSEKVAKGMLEARATRHGLHYTEAQLDAAYRALVR